MGELLFRTDTLKLLIVTEGLKSAVTINPTDGDGPVQDASVLFIVNTCTVRLAPARAPQLRVQLKVCWFPMSRNSGSAGSLLDMLVLFFPDDSMYMSVMFAPAVECDGFSTVKPK